MSEKTKNYFFKSFFTILIAIGVLAVLKQILPNQLFDENTSLTTGIVVDSLALEAMADTTIYTSVESSTETDSIDENKVYIQPTANSEGFSNLSYFYSKLYELEIAKHGKVRIAYFSDSMTDGDLIVQDIRSAFQEKFGGRGVGFVGITSLSAGSRYSVTHQYSQNWQTQSFLSTKKPRRAFGVDGQVAFVPRGSQSAWVNYRANDLVNSTQLYNPTLFYGSSSNQKASISINIDKDSVIQGTLEPYQLLNTYAITGAPKNIKIQLQGADSIPFYGVNFDNGLGVHVDNFSIRGNSGLTLSLFNKDLMNAFNQVLHYDLIVLHYGANVLNYGTTDYSWYDNKMTGVVNHLKECFPQADILIVSTADRAIKKNMEMQTDDAVEPLIKSQKAYAENTHSGFINLYALMGGKGSMVEWVKSSPSLANKDYTHFNVKGAKKIGLLIYGELEKGYSEYKKSK